MCIFHKYETIVTQTCAKRHNMGNLMRDVSICKKCAKIKYTMLDSSYESRYYLNYGWEPEIDIIQYKRDIKLNKLLK